MHFFTYALAYSVSLLAGLVVCLKIGHMMGRRHQAMAKASGGSALDGVVFAVLGLLLGFSFSASIDTYTAHRAFLFKEANDISLAFAKVDLLPEDDQVPLRAMLLEYAAMRLAATEAAIGSGEEQTALLSSKRLEDGIWTRVMEAVKKTGSEAALTTVVGTFSSMTDATADQMAEQQSHMPRIIYILIFILCLMAALVAGFGMGTAAAIPLLRTAVFALSVVAITYVIIDMEHPRSGIFQSQNENVALRAVIEDMRDLQTLRQSLPR